MAEKTVNDIIKDLKSFKGITRKTKIRAYVNKLPDSSRLLLANSNVEKNIKNIISSLSTMTVVPSITAMTRHPNWSESTLESTVITGTIPLSFYDNLAQYHSLPKETWEGSSGTAFIYRDSNGPRYIIKSMKDSGNFTSRENQKEKQQKKIIETIQSIKHELNVNIELTEKIPEYVSKCIGTYLFYNVMNMKYEFQAYFVFEYLPGLPLNVWIQKNKNSETYQQDSSIIVSSLEQCVHALHKAGYVHRDLKPKNVYVVQRDNIVERCVLIDFGEALPIGTPENIEKIRGIKAVSNHAENDEIFNPLLANTTTDRFFNRYTGHVTPEQNIISFERIRNLPIENGGLFQRSINVSELHNAFPGVFVKSKQRLGGTRKKNKRTRCYTKRH